MSLCDFCEKPVTDPACSEPGRHKLAPKSARERIQDPPAVRKAINEFIRLRNDPKYAKMQLLLLAEAGRSLAWADGALYSDYRHKESKKTLRNIDLYDHPLFLVAEAENSLQQAFGVTADWKYVQWWVDRYAPDDLVDLSIMYGAMEDKDAENSK
jgi:hypothetical protein